MTERKSTEAPRKIVLAYSGGLDTSTILAWLRERHPSAEIVAFVADVGQGDEIHGIERKAKSSGASEVIVLDLRRELLSEFCFPMLRARADYEVICSVRPSPVRSSLELRWRLRGGLAQTQ